MNLVGSSIAFQKLLHDLLLWEADQETRYTRTSIKLTNGTGSDVEYELGSVIADASLSDNATDDDLQPAFTDALLLENCTVPANDTLDVAALVRGPALVNFDEIVRTSEGESDASVIARLADLVSQGVRFVREPSVQSTVDLNS